jgi:hypothetical protein
MTEDNAAYVGALADDPAFAVMSWTVEASMGEPIESYARALSGDEVEEFNKRLDDVEPAHADAAARMHTFFAG